MQNVQEVVRTLLKNGAKRIDNAVVKTVSINRQENYDRVALTLAKPVTGYTLNKETGEYEKSDDVRTIFVSSFSIGAILADNEDSAFAKRFLMEKPQMLELVLSYAKVDILQESVEANTDYVNPFSSSTEGRMIDHDTIINHIVAIELGKRGLRFLAKLEDKMVDRAFGDITNNDEEEI